MLDIPHFVLKCNLTLLPAATVVQTDQGLSYVKYESWFRPFIASFDELINTPPILFKHFNMCEESKCFFKALDEMDSPSKLYGLFERGLEVRNPSNLNQRIELLNKFIELLRKKLNSQAVKRAIRTREEHFKDSFASSRLLVNKLFRKHEKLFVISFDLAFIPDIKYLQINNLTDLNQEFHAPHQLEYLKRAIEQFLENRWRNKTLKKIVGYFFRFGHSIKKGFYVRVIFFLAADEYCKKSHFIDYLTEYWTNLTHGKGCTYDLEQGEGKYPKSSIDLICDTDTEERKKLMINIECLYRLNLYFIFKHLEATNYRQVQKSRPPVIITGKTKVKV